MPIIDLSKYNNQGAINPDYTTNDSTRQGKSFNFIGNVPTNGSSFVSSVDFMPNANVVNMKSGSHYLYNIDANTQQKNFDYIQQSGGHFGAEYWQEPYLSYYQGRDNPTQSKLGSAIRTKKIG